MEAYVDFPWAPPGATGRLAFGAPAEVVVAHDLAQVRPALARVEDECAAGRHAVGFVSYEAAPAFDPAMRVRGGSRVPLVWFGLHDTPLPAEGAREPAAYACSVWRPGTDESTYAASIQAIRAAIARGDTYQVNHTMRLRARFAGDPLGAWADLRRAQRDGWFAYVDTGRHAVASVSPELFFTWDGQQLVTRPMKGTRGRDRHADTDAALAADLRASAKDRAENLMIVDLLRNDIARVSEPGSVRVPRLFDVEAYPTVWQMTSTVTGTGRGGLGVGEIFAALFPCGSITGAPKVRTMELIAAFEDRPRGVYCGAVGVVFPGGAAAFNVAIRTLVVDRQEPVVARYDVGGGVVWDSQGRDEYAEALAKAAVLDMTQRDVGLVETARVHRGQAWLQERHLDRMAASAHWFGWPFDRVRAGELLRRSGDPAEGPMRARLVLRPAGVLRVETAPLIDDVGAPGGAGPARVVALAGEAVNSADPWLRHKTTRRGVYRRALAAAVAARGAGPSEAIAAGPEAGPDQSGRAPGSEDLFDVLLHNERGELTEFTIGNLVVDLDGEWVTPPVDSGLLPGTLRAELLATGVIIERAIRVADLPRVRALWLINAVRGWVPVVLGTSPAPAQRAVSRDPAP